MVTFVITDISPPPALSCTDISSVKMSNTFGFLLLAAALITSGLQAKSRRAHARSIMARTPGGEGETNAHECAERARADGPVN